MKINKIFLTLLLCLGLLSLSLAYAQAPSLSLKDSIALADKALEQAKVNVGKYFLFSVVFTHSSKGDYWYYTYRPVEASEYNQVYVRVYVTGETEISGGELSQGGY